MKAVFVCPGRGTYNKTELGYLARHFPDPALLARFDAQRADGGQPKLSELDGAARFSVATHTRGDNASGLIFAATLGDFQSINREEVEIVAVTGNSMGWYTALACAGALSAEDGFRVANGMGTMMQRALIGGQTVYPVMDDDWKPDPARRLEVLALIGDIAARPGHALFLSIDLGGMLVVAGDEPGLAAFERAVPAVQQRYPMRLANHAAFHTPLMAPVASAGRDTFTASLFRDPGIPLVDGRGAIWWPGCSEPGALRDYTLGAQVLSSYDFTRAITVAAREFAPDIFIVAGPGNTLGGAVIQSLILADWRGLRDKASFRALQSSAPLVASTGLAEQRAQVSRP